MQLRRANAMHLSHSGDKNVLWMCLYDFADRIAELLPADALHAISTVP
jgi:hypothetical protein